jgi:ABC-type transport system involved in multi-copper enzyme maturation permease subunit
MIRAILWKEWCEHRWKYASYWLVLNCPILIVALSVAFNTGARAPFGELSNSTALKYLDVAMVAESFLLVTLFLMATALLAVATFRPELEDGSLFFLFEQPLPRRRYAALKFLNSALHVVLASVSAVFFGPLLGYALMLASGKVTLAGSMGTFGALFAAGARASVWCSLISLAIFAGCALVSALVPRWWLATVGSILLVVLLVTAGSDFFDFIQPSFDALQEGSISVGFGSAEWLKVSGPLPMHAFAPLRALPLLAALLFTTLAVAATGFLYTRKELK